MDKYTYTHIHTYIYAYTHTRIQVDMTSESNIITSTTLDSVLQVLDVVVGAQLCSFCAMRSAAACHTSHVTHRSHVARHTSAVPSPAPLHHDVYLKSSSPLPPLAARRLLPQTRRRRLRGPRVRGRALLAARPQRALHILRVFGEEYADGGCGVREH